MHDRKKPATPEAPPTPAPEPNKGGFGAFAEVYRTRWAANHPHMRRREPAANTDDTPDPPTPSDSSPGETPRRDADGTRLLRPED